MSTGSDAPPPTADQINAAAVVVCDARQRAILHLVYEEELSFRRVALLLGLHHSTVSAGHDRAFDLIRAHLEGGPTA